MARTDTVTPRDTKKTEKPGQKITPEELDSALAEFVALLEAEEPSGEHVRAERRGGRAEVGAWAHRAALASLRGIASRDVQVVAPFDEKAGIDEVERDREIAKAALARLKVSQLERLAADLGVSIGRSRLELLDRLTEFLGADEQEIAELVVRYSDRQGPTRRHATRLVPTVETLSITEWQQRLADFVGQYLRTDVAEWFVFGSERATARDLTVEGSLLRYEVESASLLLDSSGKYGFRTAERADDVVLRVRDSQPILRIQARAYHESRAAVRALLFAAQLSRSDQLLHQPNYDRVGFATIAQQTAWFLAVVRTCVDDPEVRLRTVTSVTFQRDRSGVPRGGNTARIDSSRFKGEHVLDTPEIASYIEQGQVIEAVSFTADLIGPDGSVHVLPCRIAVEDSSLLVATSFGSAGPDAAGILHLRLEDVVAASTEHGPLDAGGTNDLLKGVLKRAHSSEERPVATLFIRSDVANRAELAQIT
jgi:hypothetical protein